MMKQRINLKQFKELSDNAQTRLLNWLNKEQGKPGANSNDLYESASFALSIGKMIEFLDQHKTKEMMSYWGVAHITTTEKNIWYVGEDGGDELSNMGNYEDKELCDALWEAVKEVLESK